MKQWTKKVLEEIVSRLPVQDGQIGVVLERPSTPDRASRQMLFGDMGQLLIRPLAQFGVDVRRDCIVTYAACTQADLHKLEQLRADGVPAEGLDAWLNDPIQRARRIEIVRPYAERLQAELAGCTKVLCCGAMAMAAVYPLDHIPRFYHKKRGLGVCSAWGSPTKFLVPTYSLQQLWAAPDYYRDFYFDVQKICSGAAPQPEPDVTTVVVRSLEQARIELGRLRSASIIACDIETEPHPDVYAPTDDDRKRAALDPLRSLISCIGFGVMYRDDGRKGHAVVIPKELLYPKSQDLCGLISGLIGEYSTYPGAIVWQNFVFDAQHLAHYLGAWPFHPHTQDTLLMNYALDERPIGRFGVHSLKDMARYRFDREYGFDWKEWNGKPEAERPYDDLYRYNGEDTFHTARMFEVLRAEMEEEEEPSAKTLVHDLLMPASMALARVARTGLLVDRHYLDQLGEDFGARMGKRRAALVAYAAQRGALSFDPSSPVQVAQFLFDTLSLPMPNVRLKNKKPGSWSTQKLVLDKLRHFCTEEQKTFLDDLNAFRLYAKTRTTYIDAIRKQISLDGRIHPNLQLAGTATGRLSSFSPNLQNIPVHTAKEIREAFIAAPGHTLIEADYKNLELRVAGYFSQEPVLVDAFARGEDLHRATAAKVFNKPIDQVTDHERFLAKAVGFGLLYGRSAEAIAEGHEMDEFEAHGGTRWTLEIARQFHDEYLNSMPTLKRWLQEHTARGFALKRTVTPFGRVRRFPLVLARTRGEVERQIVNTLIQSTASDITLTALIRLVDALPAGAAVVLTVHDSILVECRDDLVPHVKTLLCAVMEHPPLEDRGVPWSVDLHEGKTWADVKE